MNSRTGIVMPDPALQTDAFRGRSAEPPRRKLLRGLITPFFRRKGIGRSLLRPSLCDEASAAMQEHISALHRLALFLLIVFE